MLPNIISQGQSKEAFIEKLKSHLNNYNLTLVLVQITNVIDYRNEEISYISEEFSIGTQNTYFYSGVPYDYNLIYYMRT